MNTRYYYVADTKTKIRLRPVHRTLEAAAKRTARFNARDPGRYICGDWVLRGELHTNRPDQWPWQP